jgi:hypothetical protein
MIENQKYKLIEWSKWLALVCLAISYEYGFRTHRGWLEFVSLVVFFVILAFLRRIW